MTTMTSQSAPTMSNLGTPSTINPYDLGLLFVVRCRYWSCRASNDADDLRGRQRTLRAVDLRRDGH